MIQPHATIPVQTIDASDDRIQRVEQMLRHLRVAKGMDVWDGFDSAPVTPLPPKFWIPDMERYTCRGCPLPHLRIYSQLIRGMGLDDAQLIMLFPLSLSSVAQSWFATLDASRRRTWEDLAHETAISFISRWREKVIQMIDHPSKKEQISMIMRSL